MLIKIGVENFKSFEDLSELSMIQSSKIQSHQNHKMNAKGVNLLKYAVVYGANAAGKSNLVEAINFMKFTLINSLPLESIKLFCRTKEENKNKASTFELQFTIGRKVFAYGFSAFLHNRVIAQEWLYELQTNGKAKPIFEFNGTNPPELSAECAVSAADRERFNVYANDYTIGGATLFLSELNRGKKYSAKSKLFVFQEVYQYLINNVIVVTPNSEVLGFQSCYKQEVLAKANDVLRSLDTGIDEVRIEQITAEKLSREIPSELYQQIFENARIQFQNAEITNVGTTIRHNDKLFNVIIERGKDPVISTLLMKHSNAKYDYEFADESEGTKRLFCLIDMLLTESKNTVFIMDELERSFHPKLTEQFIKLFSEIHENDDVQLIFTTHESTIMRQDLFRRDEIWFVDKGSNNTSKIYSLDRFKERYDKTISKSYLDGRYGAVPIFSSFSINSGV